MKKRSLLLFVLLASFQVNAQNIGIGNPIPLAKLHVSNGASGNTTPFGPVVVEANNNTYINLLSPDAFETSVLFGKASDAASGGIVYNNLNTLDGLQFRVNGNQTKMVIDKFGRIGIGILIPQRSLDVSGDIRTTGMGTMGSLTISSGGAISDFLVRSDVNGLVAFKKGYAGLGVHYMIALQGSFPAQGGPFVNGTYIGEIRMFSGNAAPFGWMFCEGQLLTVTGNEILFAVIGTLYGGNGVTNFNLPDLRDAVPVGQGTNWQLGERSN